MISPAVRNVLIIIAIAAVVWLVPGGGDGADLVAQILGAAFIVATALILGRFYQQFRAEIFGLGDQWRFLLYAAGGVIVVTLSASGRLFETGPGTLAWLALLGGASFALYAVWQQYKAY